MGSFQAVVVMRLMEVVGILMVMVEGIVQAGVVMELKAVVADKEEVAKVVVVDMEVEVMMGVVKEQVEVVMRGEGL